MSAEFLSRRSWSLCLHAILPLVLIYTSFAVEITGNLDNPGLEEPFYSLEASGDASETGGEIAYAWAQMSGQAIIRYAQETDEVKQGASAQRIEIESTGGREVEFNLRLKNLEKDVSHRFTIWLKSNTFTRARLFVRQTSAPYEVYFGKSVETTPEWTAFQIEGIVGSPDVRFVIGMSNAATFWVDDLQVETVEEGDSAFLQGDGNLLPNASFEAGIGAGWRVLMRSGANLPAAARAEALEQKQEVDPGTAFSGKSSLKIPLVDGQGVLVTSPLLRVAGERDYTASLALKSDIPLKATISLVGENSRKDVYSKTTVDVGEEWRRFSLKSELPAGARVRLNLQCGSEASGTLWVDSGQLEEGRTMTAWRDAFPVELAMEVPRPGAIFFDGEKAEINISIAGEVSGKAFLRGTLESLTGGTNSLPDMLLPVEKLEIPVDAKQPRGMFKVRVAVVDSAGNPLSATEEKNFARLPQPKEISSERSFFGAHIPLRPKEIAIARATGIRWVRLHDASVATLWAIMEPVRDQFQFVDEGVDAARAAGLEILGLLNGAPAWVSKKPRATSGYFSAYNFPDTPGGFERWRNYVSKVTTHFKGRIGYWQVWNEPWHKTFFLGTPEQYGELLKIAHATAKETDPDLQIVGFGAAAHKYEWVKEALKAAGSEAYDIFAFHDYNPSFYEGERNNALRLAAQFREWQEPFGPPKPLWNTEGGPGHVASWYGAGETKNLSPRRQMSHIVKFDVGQMAAGVRRFFYYTLHGTTPSGEDGFSILEHDFSIRPALAARAVLASLLDGAEFLERLEISPGVEGFRFRNEDGSLIMVAWCEDGRSHELPVPEGIRVLDILGNDKSSPVIRLTSEPVYLLG